MRFDISRQPIVPAFFTLLLLCIVMVWGVDAQGDMLPEGLRATPACWLAEPSEELITAAGAGAVGSVDSPEGAFGPTLRERAEGLAVAMPGVLIARFQTHFPGWSQAIAALLMCFAGLSTGRLTVRYNLYAVASCLAIPLFGVVVCGLCAGDDYLTAFVVATLVALVGKNFCRAFCNGYGFDAIFRGAFYLGLLLLVYPPALPLLLLLPFAVLLFRRTLREVLVALVGLCVWPLAFGYVGWAAGGRFTAPFEGLWSGFVGGYPFGLLLETPVPLLVLLASVLLLTLFAILVFLRDIYFVGTRARFTLMYAIGALLLSVAALCGPAATPAAYAFVAAPAAMLMPVLFVRIRPVYSLPVYLLLLAGALLGAVLQ